MATPNQFRLTLPGGQLVTPTPVTEGAPATSRTGKPPDPNVRTLERWARNLPFPRSHRYNIEEDVLIEAGNNQEFDIYPTDGYYAQEPGTFQSIITVLYLLPGVTGTQIVGVEGTNDISLLGLTPSFPRLEERYPEAVSSAMNVTRTWTFQGFFDMPFQTRRWEPRLTFYCGVGNPDLRIASISAFHMFWPEGLTNTLLKSN